MRPLALVFVVACGGGGDDPPAIDAPAQQSTVMVVEPCAGETGTVMALGTRFDPVTTTITMGQIVKIVSDVSHPIGPSGTMTDPALVVPESATRCFRFTAPGTFKVRCTVHGFVGTITVN